jgi:hypothetical protein
MTENIKAEMETKAQRGELQREGISRNATFNRDGTLFLDCF